MSWLRPGPAAEVVVVEAEPGVDHDVTVPARGLGEELDGAGPDLGPAVGARQPGDHGELPVEGALHAGEPLLQHPARRPAGPPRAGPRPRRGRRGPGRPCRRRGRRRPGWSGPGCRGPRRARWRRSCGPVRRPAPRPRSPALGSCRRVRRGRWLGGGLGWSVVIASGSASRSSSRTDGAHADPAGPHGAGLVGRRPRPCGRRASRGGRRPARSNPGASIATTAVSAWPDGRGGEQVVDVDAALQDDEVAPAGEQAERPGLPGSRRPRAAGRPSSAPDHGEARGVVAAPGGRRTPAPSASGTASTSWRLPLVPNDDASSGASTTVAPLRAGPSGGGWWAWPDCPPGCRR